MSISIANYPNLNKYAILAETALTTTNIATV